MFGLRLGTCPLGFWAAPLAGPSAPFVGAPSWPAGSGFGCDFACGIRARDALACEVPEPAGGDLAGEGLAWDELAREALAGGSPAACLPGACLP